MRAKGNSRIPGIYANRFPSRRSAALQMHGGSAEWEAAGVRALRWLKSKQLPNGSWAGQSTANTAFALLCFLGHGEMPGAEANPEFGETVEKAIRFLIETQIENGLFKSRDGNNYAHLIAVCALAEAYALAAGTALKSAAEKAVAHIINGKNLAGGWDYNMMPTDRNDTSYSGRAAQAVKAAKVAQDTHGLNAPGLEQSCARAINGFKANASPNGGFGYTNRGQGGLSGIGALCMQLLGAAKEPEVSKTLEYLKSCKFSFSQWDIGQPRGWGGNPVYYWHYITQAKFHNGGNDWTA